MGRHSEFGVCFSVDFCGCLCPSRSTRTKATTDHSDEEPTDVTLAIKFKDEAGHFVCAL